MYTNTSDGVSEYIQQSVCAANPQQIQQQNEVADECTQNPFHTCLNDILMRYPSWSNRINDIENSDEAGYRDDRQDIAKALQKDTVVKTQDNSQLIDNIEMYARERAIITQSLNARLGLEPTSLPEAQVATAATVHQDQLTTKIPTHLSRMTLGIGQNEELDDYDDEDEELYQVDSPTDIHTPPDNLGDNENNEPDTNAHKRGRRNYAKPDMVRKAMTKQRQAEILR